MPRSLPLKLLVERASATGNDAVEVGMMIQVLSPGMQHHQKADASAQVSATARDSHQGFGGGAAVTWLG